MAEMTHKERKHAARQLRALAEKLDKPDPEPRTKTTNDRMRDLHRRYGTHISIDFFPSSNSWRVWVRDWHYHFSDGVYYGGLLGDGHTIDDAIDRIEAQVKIREPNQGGSCREFCPHYEVDLY
jgi:hypothetical protein